MGIVYKAEDTKLKRPVALKFLASHLLGDRDEKERFLREAQAAAALDHPNICTVHEIDEADGRTFISMAYIAGQSLNDKIAAGPLKLEETLALAIGIGQGLQEAHEHKVVHRDIKSANVIVTPKGEPKITDFGLAYLADRSKLTKSGTTLGTPMYMSPEQAMGKTADRRSDIWSLGVVLYEMVTGLLPFAGDYEQVIIYEIINEPHEPVTARRAGLPMELDRIVGKALAKDADERYQHVDEIVVDLKALSKSLAAGKPTISGTLQGTRTEIPRAAERPTEPVPLDAEVAPLRRPAVQRNIAAGVLIAVLAAVAIFWPDSATIDRSRVLRFSPAVPSDVRKPVISPDGRHIAWLQGEPPAGKVWVLDLDKQEPREIAATEGAWSIFWSHDSHSIGFFTLQHLKKVPTGGGAAVTLREVRNEGGRINGAWSPDGDSIVFNLYFDGTLWEISTRGGPLKPLVSEEETKGRDWYGHPHFLPVKGRRLLLLRADRSAPKIVLRDLTTGEETFLAEGSQPAYSPTGHILYQSARENLEFLSSGSIWALPFSLVDAQAVGEPFPIVSDAIAPSIASDGTLVYLESAHGGGYQLGWRGRDGAALGRIGQPQSGRMAHAALSPDERRVAVLARERDQLTIWLHDTARAVRTRLTLDLTGMRPIWSPAGDRITFNADRQSLDVYTIPANGRGQAKPLIESPLNESATHWSADGKHLLFLREDTNGQLWYLRRKSDGAGFEEVLFLKGPYDIHAAQFSPDGRFVAYVSDESGRKELYVTRFPDAERKWPVSTNGARQPRWRRDGSELYYAEGTTLVAAAVRTRPDFSVERTTRLFDAGILGGGDVHSYDVSADGQRFVLPEPVEGGKPAKIRVVMNWYEEFRDRERD